MRKRTSYSAIGILALTLFCGGGLSAITSVAEAKTIPPSALNPTPSVKKSIVGICHAKGTRYYKQTKFFIPFATLKDCLKSGGRLPKK